MAALNFSGVLGQEPVKSALEKGISQNRLPHALLFHGPKGTGKFAAAVALAQTLLCGKKSGCGNCPPCKQVAAFSHPDLSLVIPLPSPGSPPERKKEEERGRIFADFITAKKENRYQPVWKENKDFITVTDLQALQERLSRKPLEGDWKVAILVEADRMQLPQAGNKLLKTLEEPHPNTLIILIAERPKNLLPTILSRTQRYYFSPLSVEILTRFTEATFSLSKSEAERLARASSGSAANLFFLQKGEELERRERAWETLKLALAGKEGELFLALKKTGDTRKKEDILSFFGWLELFLWELFCLNELKMPQRIVSQDLKPEFEKASATVKSRFPFLFALTELNRTRQDLERNVGFRLSLFWLFARILKYRTA
jgi:DNA polymerase-3 subunit delta'